MGARSWTKIKNTTWIQCGREVEVHFQADLWLYTFLASLYTLDTNFFSYSNYAISSCDQQNYPIQPNVCLGLNTHHWSTLQKGNSSLYSHQQGGNAHLSTPLPELHIIPLKYLAFLWPFKLDLAFLNTDEDELSSCILTNCVHVNGLFIGTFSPLVT